MTRILMTADSIGGVWTYAMALCGGLCGRGFEVHLATAGRTPTTAQRAEADAIPGLTLHPSAHRLCWMPGNDAAAQADADAWLADLVREIRPGLIHANDFGHAHALRPEITGTPLLVVAHSCVLSWWLAVHGTPAPPAWDDYRVLVTRALHAAGAVVAPTAAMARSAEQLYGVRPVRVIPNGLPPVSPPPRSEKAPFVLSAGRIWDEGKNIGALAAIARTLPWPVVVAGDTGPGDAPPLVGVTLTGQLAPDAMARHYRRAAVFALPARYEPFGLAALQAAQHGCALVLGDIPSLREVWGDAALFVPPDDRDRLRATLLRVTGDTALRRRLAQRALRRALCFGLPRMTTAYEEAYRSLPRGAAAVRAEAD